MGRENRCYKNMEEKRMTKKILATSIVTAIMLALVGCGGSGADSTVATGKSFYLDSAVSGINYKCGTQEGITDAEGAFTFDVGSSCTFYLGDIELRSVAENVLKDGESLIEIDVKIAQLLQTLDIDGDPSNGITVSPEILKALAIALNANGGNGTLPNTEEELNVLSAELEREVADYEGHAVTEVDAAEHLAITQANVLKAFFAEKTLYHINDDKNIVEAVVFNSDATTLQFGTEAAVNINFGAHSIIDKDGEHFIDKITDKYVKGHDSYGEFIFYFVKLDAQDVLAHNDAESDIGSYVVYGGNTYFSGDSRKMPNNYTRIGEGKSIKIFNAQYKYYVITNENSNLTIYIDAVKGSDNHYYATNTTSNTYTSSGDTWQNLEGAPDQKYVSIGAYGYILIDASQTNLRSIEVFGK